ncbi:DUF1800 domain-containing protein [Silanimonas sp.]|uniref:DUF1800 domain-containing protein n=1 Tax=Silanimonas sp. TaxID=1929290 RepID=UPI0022C3D8D9|nr:DUF1800 domain-containing protein [Silanimonas sp.]MCZ8116470.1 DUF1800 domain-containing protein [Silanimonas sp.]
MDNAACSPKLRGRLRRTFALLLALGLAMPAVAQTGTPAQRDAARLLTQATFGPTSEEINRVGTIGPSAWIDEQMAAPATLHLAALDSHYRALLPLYNLGPAPESECVLSTLCRYARRDVWWRTAITAPDQLRQRVAFALSQFFVVSDLNADVNYTQYSPADFYDTLVVNAFGDFRTLLRDVSLHPAMGRYLGMLQNEKADPAKNTEPDENYAREVMQLFSIGLSELNPDGTVRTDAQGAPLPTYGDNEITAFARVFTGWNFANATRWKFNSKDAGIPGYIDAMKPMEAFHDTGGKTLLRGQVLASGRTATADLDSAIDNLANHPNVGPFLARHLIQRLVTSNPSPAYIGRVAAAFANNGQGKRGDLAAVVRAVLLDPEARDPSLAASASYGKLREPLLRYTTLWRAFASPGVAVANKAGRVEGIFRFYNTDGLLAQAPLSAPSVFNFYRPNYRRPGEIRDLGLFSPEFQILNDNTALNMVNQLHNATFNADLDAPGVNRMLAGPLATLGNHGLDLRTEKTLALSDPAALIDHLNLLLMGGTMSPGMRTVLVDSLRAMPTADGGRQRAEDTLFLILSSPQFAVQR